MTLPLAAKGSDSLLSEPGLLDLVGGAAGALALLMGLLLLPLYLSHRREVARLTNWKEREPEAGTTEFRAIPDPAAGPAARGSGRMTPAERVTSERPALARITTAEHRALELEAAPLWRRAIERGPRHPLVLTLMALLIAGAVFVAAAMFIRSRSEQAPSGAGRPDPASVQVVVVNAAASPGVAGNVADNLSADGFDVTGTTAKSGSVAQSSVRYAEGAKAEAKLVARFLGLSKPAPFTRADEVAADGAEVVVTAGRDAERANSGGKG